MKWGGGKKKSHLRDRTVPTMFLPYVAKQHDVFADVIAFGVHISACAGF